MQDEVNQDYSEQNEVDGMKKGADLLPNYVKNVKIVNNID